MKYLILGAGPAGLTFANRLKQVGITPYTKLKEYVTMEEYEVLPCCYLDAVLANNDNCDMSSFIDAIRLFREK